MATESIYLVRLASWLGKALGASVPLFHEFFTDALGLELPAAVTHAPAVASALGQVEAAANKVGEAATAMAAADEAGDDLQILAALIRFASTLVEFYHALSGLVSAIQANLTATTIPDAAARASAQAFAADLAKKISDYAIASAITERVPELAYGLKLLGLLDWEYQGYDSGDSLSRSYVRKGLRLDRVKGLIGDPEKHFRETLGWGDPGFDPTGFFRVIRGFFHEEDDIEIGEEAGEPFLKGCLLVRRDSSVSPPGLRLTLIGDFDADRSQRLRLTDEWGFVTASSFRMVGGVSGQIRPPLAITLQPLSGSITGELRIFFERNEEARPFQLIGGTGGTVSLSANNIQAGVGLKAEADTGGSATLDPLLFADIDRLALHLGSSDADGFIARLLAAADIEGEFDLGLEWRASTGLRVRASGGIEIALPIHRQLGPVDFQTLYLALRILPDGTLSQEVSAGLAGNLGPLHVAIERMGVLMDLRFTESVDARFGPFDTALGFKPPNGVGLVVDAGVVTGGGYLYFDFDRGEYAGALELSIAGIVTVKAIGIITTRMPDGSKGFSLLIIITAEFGTGIQLGFGFTLLGVGGLLGLNRTMSLQPLMEGVRSGAINSIMFPQNPVENAARIISDLRIIFPPYEGKFLIGPMAKLGWGTPTLVSISLGIIIEIPGNIAIVGVLKVALPAEDAPLIVIQVNFAGAIEFDKKRLYFFASLFESRILFLTLEGEMGLLVAWGDDANFVVSVGGFHPRFNPPPLPFPSPRRIVVSILNTDVARIRTETYFAVTSNTVQFGSRTEVMFDVGVARVDGHLAFDALFQFSPFYFIIEISASVSLKVFGLGLFSIRLQFALEGPTPWRAHGTGTLSLFFFDVSADFDITWGDSKDTTLPPIPVMPLLRVEIDKLENWKAELPANNNLLVSLRKLPEAETAQVLHPLGLLRISQRAMPLDLKIDKVGNRKPSDANEFTLAPTAGLVKAGDADEQFAKAQFLDMSDAEKLSQRAFDPLHGGVVLASGTQQLGAAKLAKRRVRYEQIIIDSNYKHFRRRFKIFTAGFFDHFVKGSAISNSFLSNSYTTNLDPFEDKVKVREGGFTVALVENNRPYSTSAAYFSSEALANRFIAEQISAKPELYESLHVVPQYEASI
ncbi:MAG TPA: DUF6603 domain-containing protein [Nitrosospira sp.]|nr:DUF6603 domain-containing protein [Nitrosospira sp.]